MSKNLTSADIIHADVLAYGADRRRYDAYVSAVREEGGSFTLDTVSEHVAAFMADYDKSTKFDATTADADTKYARKQYQMRVRDNLKRRAGFVKAEAEPSTKYATALALKDGDREAAVLKFLAEWDAAHAPALNTAA